MSRNFLPSFRAPKRGNLYGYFLPKALIHLSLKVQTSDQGSEIFLQIHKIKHIPDPEHYYTFSYNPSANAEDDIVVKYGSNGFLSQVHTQIDDKTDDVISSLADILGSLVEVAGPAPAMVTPGMMKARSLNSQDIYEGVIDPFSEQDLAEVNAKVQEVTGDSFKFEARILGNQGEEGGEAVEISDKSGIYCKPRAVVEIGVFGPGGKETEIVQIPHPKVLEFIEIPTARFVKTEFEVTFTEEGYPNYIHINKPSSTLAFIQAPLALLKALVAIPASIFQFRVNLNNMKSQSIRSEFEYRKAVLDYGNRLKELESQNDPDKPTVVTPGSIGPSNI